MRHTEIWHSHPTSFTCPLLASAETSNLFFDPYDDDPDNEDDSCLLCGETIPSSDWKGHAQHLKKVHRFSKCAHEGRFYREEQFARHVANAHNVGIEGLGGFVDGCRREEKPPALAVRRKAVR